MASPSALKGRNGDRDMKGQGTKLHAAEIELKQLMADVSQAMQKAQDAIARITCKPATAEVATEAAASSH